MYLGLRGRSLIGEAGSQQRACGGYFLSVTGLNLDLDELYNCGRSLQTV